MSYSYYNDSGKLISGAAANSHKIYTIHGGPKQYWLRTVVYAATGLILAGIMKKRIHDIGDSMLKK